LTLIEVIRQACRRFAHTRSRCGALTQQANPVVLGGNRRTEDRKMADQAALGTSMKPAPPVPAVPPRVPDLPRPGAEPAHAPASSSQSADGVDGRTLVVGRGTSFSGDVSSCDRLIVEGSIDASLQNCQSMIIAENGLFRGNGSTVNADVRGRVEGDLVVHKRLLIRASGHVSGTINYGEIEIEAGGKISGAIQAHERPKRSGPLKRPGQAIDANSPSEAFQEAAR
jgi:cytoskeletal protein CcmA (bactofilin family)